MIEKRNSLHFYQFWRVFAPTEIEGVGLVEPNRRVEGNIVVDPAPKLFPNLWVLLYSAHHAGNENASRGPCAEFFMRDVPNMAAEIVFVVCAVEFVHVAKMILFPAVDIA